MSANCGPARPVPSLFVLTIDPDSVCINILSAFTSVTRGVGSEAPPAPTEVWGTNGLSGYKVPFRVIPDLGQASEYSANSPHKETWYVLHKRISGSYFANDSKHFPLEAATFTVKPDSLPCC